MDKRTIIVKNSQNQQTVKLETAVTTLGELKSLLSNQYGMTFENATFHEGKTKSSFNDDAAILPSNINYRGTVTNDLMFLVTTKNKKISSGAMSRMEVFAYIKANNLKDAIKKEFNKNFTICKTDELVEFVEKHQKGATTKAIETAEKAVETPTEELVDTESDAAKLVIIPNVREAFERLTDLLVMNGALEEEEAEEVLEVLGTINEVSVTTSDNSNLPDVSEAIDFDDDAFAFVK